MPSRNQQFLRRLAFFLLAVVIAVAVGAVVGAVGWARWEVIAIALFLTLFAAYRLLMPDIIN